MTQLLMHSGGMRQCPGGLKAEEISAIGRHGAEAVDTGFPSGLVKGRKQKTLEKLTQAGKAETEDLGAGGGRGKGGKTNQQS